MHIGATLGRRFTLLRTDTYDLPGVERFVANDARLDTDVYVDVVTSEHPEAVRDAAKRAGVVRDQRINRVIATGVERHDGRTVTYIVSALPEGVRLDALLARHTLPVDIAAAILGEAARALKVAAARGLHHGALRGESITVTSRGRIVISGIGVDAELAHQAGTRSSLGERNDSSTLARLFLGAIVGKDGDALELGDVPDDLAPAAVRMVKMALRGTGPRTLDSVLRALQPFTSHALRGLPTAARDLALRPDVAAAEMEARAGILPQALLVSDETLAIAAATAAAAAVAHLASAVLALRLAAQEEAASPLAEGDLHDLYTFDAIVEEQLAERSADPSPALSEVFLERARRRWPESRAIAGALEHARERAARPGPIRAEPFLMAVGVGAVVIGAMVAFSLIQAPIEYEGERYNNPANTYPPFTFSPSPSLSPSATLVDN